MMRSLIVSLVATLALSPAVASAEYCWMIGCRDAIGFVPVYAQGTGSIFLGAPRVGANATLAQYVYLRLDPIAKPQGPYIVAPGTVVRVLELLDRNGVKFAVVRVVTDKNVRPDECKSTMNCNATFY